jgi:hypothetical protein
VETKRTGRRNIVEIDHRRVGRRAILGKDCRPVWIDWLAAARVNVGRLHHVRILITWNKEKFHIGWHFGTKLDTIRLLIPTSKANFISITTHWRFIKRLATFDSSKWIKTIVVA